MGRLRLEALEDRLTPAVALSPLSLSASGLQPAATHITSTATSNLLNVPVQFSLDNLGQLTATRGSTTKTIATGVQGLFQGHDQSGHEVAYDLIGHTLGEYTPNQGWVAIATVNQAAQDGSGDVFFRQGGRLSETTGVATSAAAGHQVIVSAGVTTLLQFNLGQEAVYLQGTTLDTLSGSASPQVLATGVTQVAIDSAGDVVWLEGPYNWNYDLGDLFTSGYSSSVNGSPQERYALDDQGNFYTFYNGVLTVAATSISPAQQLATGVTQMYADAAGEVVVLEGTHGYSYFSGLSRAIGSSPTNQYALDSHGDLFILTATGNLFESTNSTSTRQLVAAGVTGMAMDVAGEVVVREGPHAYAYFNGSTGSHGSSASTQFAIDNQGNRYTLSGGTLTIAASSTATPQAIATGMVRLVMDNSGDIAVLSGDGVLTYYNALIHSFSQGVPQLAQVVVDHQGQLYGLSNSGVVLRINTSGYTPIDYFAKSISISAGKLVTTYTTIGKYWHSLGGASSVLGLPTGPERDLPGNNEIANFASGVITYSPQTGLHYFLAPFNFVFARTAGPGTDLGMPTSNALPVYDIGGHTVGQVVYFQGGAIFSDATGGVLTSVSKHIAQIYQQYQKGDYGLGTVVSRQATLNSPVEVVTFTDGGIYWSPATGARVLADDSTVKKLGQPSDSNPAFGLADGSGWSNVGKVVGDVANQKFGVQFSAAGTLSMNLAQQTAYANVDFDGIQFDSDKLQALLNGQFVLPSINPLEVLTSLARSGTSNDYTTARANAYGSGGANAGNVYFSSSRFVDWASPETLARLTGQTVLGAGDATLNELQEQLSAEVQSIIAWVTRRFGNETQAVQALSQAFQHGDVHITPVWVNYYYKVFGQTITEQHLGFTITINGLSAGPLAPLANMIGTATTASEAAQGVSTDFLQQALADFAISLCNQVLPMKLNPAAFNLGSAIQSNLVNQSLYQTLFTKMGLSESLLVQAYKGNPIINLTGSTLVTNLQNAINSELHQFNGDLSFVVKQLTFNTSTYELNAQIVLQYAHNWGTLSDILDQVGQTLSNLGQQSAGKLADWFKKETGVVAKWWLSAGNSLPTVSWVSTAISQLPQALEDLGEPQAVIQATVKNLGGNISSSPVGKAVGKFLKGGFGLVGDDGFIPVN